jgi:hypothetical protein
LSNYILLPNGDTISEDELYHAGVKGMKWGVRKNRNNVSTSAKGRQRGGDDAPTSKKQKKSTNAAAKVKKGVQYTQKISGKKIATIVSSTAAVASGALWAASVLIPGAAAEITLARAVLSAGGAAVNLAGSLEAPKTTSRR